MGLVQAHLHAHETAAVRRPRDRRAGAGARRAQRHLHRSRGRRRVRGRRGARAGGRATGKVRHRLPRRSARRARALPRAAPSPGGPRALMHLFLSGAPGAGKSAVAPRLAELFGAPWLDLDERIARRARKPIPRIFAEDGEARFRELERGMLEALEPEYAWLVVATGGGAVVDARNRARMRALGVLVNLDADPRTLAARTREGDRPLLAGDHAARLAS